MLPLGTAWAAARKSRIFGGFLRFLTRYGKEPRRFFTAIETRAFVRGSLPAADAICPPDHGQPVTGSRLPVDGSRPAVRGLVCLGHGARGMARLD